MRGLWQLTWLELKIFLREPMGAAGTVLMPALAFFGASLAGNSIAPARFGASEFARVGLPVLAAMLTAVSAVLSLVTIIAVYREGGILKRLRATPLRPHTIVLAHVLVKLLLTTVTLVILSLLGRRVVAPVPGASLAGFALALLFSTAAILSLGFLMASVVRTARFAQPFGALVLYPMLAFSGVFVPVEAFPGWLQAATRFLPLTRAVSLLQGAWLGESWLAHIGDVVALTAFAGLSALVAARVFRWE